MNQQISSEHSESLEINRKKIEKFTSRHFDCNNICAFAAVHLPTYNKVVLYWSCPFTSKQLPHCQ